MCPCGHTCCQCTNLILKYKIHPVLQVLAKMKGSELVGMRYVPLFPYFAHMQASGAFRVVSDKYVTADGGTGVVHQAPAFGEDDHRVCSANGAPVGGLSSRAMPRTELHTWSLRCLGCRHHHARG